MTSDPTINTSAYGIDTSNISLDGCCRLTSQWNLSLFSLVDTTGQTINLRETFGPSDRRTLYGIFKAMIFIWTLSILIIDISIFAHSNFWLAYLTHWGVVMCFATNLFSLLIFVYFLPCSMNTFGRLNADLEAKIIRFIWAISIVTINVALLIVLLYWTLDYKGQHVTYLNYMKHGVLALYTTIDVLVINHTPVRLKQILLVILFEAVYFLWLMIHNFAGIGTPYTDEDPSTDDDAIYSVMNWKKRPVNAGVAVIGAVFIATPILFSLLSYLSTLLGPRYLVDCVNSSSNGIIEDDEEQKKQYS